MRKIDIIKPPQQVGAWSKRGRKVGEAVGQCIADQKGKVVVGMMGEAIGHLLDKTPVGIQY